MHYWLDWKKEISIFYLTCVDGKSRKRTWRHGRGNNQPPPTLDQQAFVEAISAATATLMRQVLLMPLSHKLVLLGTKGV